MRSILVRRILLVGLFLTIAAFLPACTINPATGKRQLNYLSLDPQQGIALGEEAAPKFLQQYGGEIPSPEISQYVSQIGHRLAAVSERPKLPWEFHVVDSSVINAFSLPGGKVFITRGLLSKLTNEAQLAGVLGHEIGHVTAEHIGQQMTRQLGLQLGLAGLGVAAQVSDKQWLQVLGAAGSVGGQLYLLHFSRSEETQADELGVRYMTKLGYNPVAQIQVMQILKKAAGGSGGLEMLSTHPLPETRIEDLEKLLKKKYPDYDNPRKYVFKQDAFQTHVLDKLKGLPAPKNTPQDQQTQGG